MLEGQQSVMPFNGGCWLSVRKKKAFSLSPPRYSHKDTHVGSVQYTSGLQHRTSAEDASNVRLVQFFFAKQQLCQLLVLILVG